MKRKLQPAIIIAIGCGLTGHDLLTSAIGLAEQEADLRDQREAKLGQLNKPILAQHSSSLVTKKGSTKRDWQ